MNARRQWLEEFLAEHTSNNGPSRSRRYTCPCCGFPLLTQRDAGEICELCNWEDDGLDDDSAEQVSPANAPFTLAQGRTAFRRYGVMYHPQDDPRIGGPDNQEELELKQAMVAAFETIQPGMEPAELQDVWRRINHLLKTLDAQLKQKILAYEAAQRKGASDIE
ncbi:MAG: CPCC family cysteine-rich protein [Planctomycetota bacterium]